RERYARELARQTAELARSNADLADFAHVAAHDLKEPLRGMRHTASFLIEDYGETLGETGRQRLERLDRLAKRMHDLLDSILEFGQMGSRELTLRECDLESIVGDVRAALAALLQRERAEVGVRSGSDPPVISVRDNGIGIEPSHHAAVFRMFKRLHTQERYGGGSGAGLAIAKRIIERHGGRIWIESRVGQGTTFSF